MENLRRVDEGVQIGSGKVSAAVDKAAQLFKLVTDALTRHSEDLTIKAEKASSDVEGVSSALNARADELGLAATRSVHSLSEVSEAMRQRLTELQSDPNGRACRFRASPRTSTAAAEISTRLRTTRRGASRKPPKSCLNGRGN